VSRESKIFLAGGCFWGLRQLLRQVPGVTRTQVGYCGGTISRPTYQAKGDHADTVEVTFDPGLTSLRNILEVFFQIHDPTTLNRQGRDVGPNYRSAVFFQSLYQARVARTLIGEMDRSGLWPGRLMTEVTKAGEFWPAEPEHQGYLQRHPNGFTYYFPRPHWALPKEMPNAPRSRQAREKRERTEP
jgi:peptide-methionine (S)-S-oxide reductase